MEGVVVVVRRHGPTEKARTFETLKDVYEFTVEFMRDGSLISKGENTRPF